MKGGAIILILGLVAAAVAAYFLLVPTAKKDNTAGGNIGDGSAAPVTGTGGSVYRLEGESLGDFIARRNADGWAFDTRLFKGNKGIFSS